MKSLVLFYLKYLQVFSLQDGPFGDIWRDVGTSLNVLETNESMDIAIDWLWYASYVLLISILLLLKNLKLVFLQSYIQKSSLIEQLHCFWHHSVCWSMYFLPALNLSGDLFL